VPALMVGALVSQWISRKLDHESFYEAVLAQDGQHVERLVPPRSLRTWMELPVARIANFSPVTAHDLTPTVLRQFLDTHLHDRFPVVTEGRLVGVLTRAEAGAALSANRPPTLESAVTGTADTALREVGQRIVNSPSGLFVLQDKIEDSGKVIGVVTLHDILRAQMNFARDQQD
jgi:CIC family chloride channel protein